MWMTKMEGLRNTEQLTACVRLTIELIEERWTKSDELMEKITMDTSFIVMIAR